MLYNEIMNESLSGPYPIDIDKSNFEVGIGYHKLPGLNGSFTIKDNTKYSIVAAKVGYDEENKNQMYWDFAADDNPDRAPRTKDEDRLQEFDRSEGGRWEIHFARHEKSGAEVNTTTGTGDQFRIFATVVEFTKMLSNRYKPDTLIIKADNADKSRVSLYSKIFNKYAPAFGMKVTGSEDDGDVIKLKLERS